MKHRYQAAGGVACDRRARSHWRAARARHCARHRGAQRAPRAPSAATRARCAGDTSPCATTKNCATQTYPKDAVNSGDTAWMLTSSVLVLMMTIPGLALFYAGMVRKKNILATLAQSFGATCVITVLWMIIGYSIAFTDGGASNACIGGFKYFLLAPLNADINIASTLAPTIPETVYMFFQMTFAIITPALIAGALADRMKYSAFLLFMGAWLLLVYCPIAHWVWGGGLAREGGRRARLRRRHRGAPERRHRRPRHRAHARQAQGPRHGELRAVQPRLRRHRRLAAVGGLVRLQRRVGGGIPRRPGRHGRGRDPDRHGGGGALLDVLPSG